MWVFAGVDEGKKGVHTPTRTPSPYLGLYKVSYFLPFRDSCLLLTFILLFHIINMKCNWLFNIIGRRGLPLLSI